MQAYIIMYSIRLHTAYLRKAAAVSVGGGTPEVASYLATSPPCRPPCRPSCRTLRSDSPAARAARRPAARQPLVCGPVIYGWGRSQSAGHLPGKVTEQSAATDSQLRTPPPPRTTDHGYMSRKIREFRTDKFDI